MTAVVDSGGDDMAHRLTAIRADLMGEQAGEPWGRRRPYIDLFVSTHPHEGNSNGFDGLFYAGDPKGKDTGDKIIIGELWISRLGLCGADGQSSLSGGAMSIADEATRRKRLYDDHLKGCGCFGNYLRIIGGDGPLYSYQAGTRVDKVHDRETGYVRITLLSPSAHILERAVRHGDVDMASIVMKMDFRDPNTEEGSEGNMFSMIIGGDACWETWNDIIARQRRESLRWDLLVAPGNCSWRFFNDYDKRDPKTAALTMLALQRGANAYIVVSSEEPVHYDSYRRRAYEAYKGSMANHRHLLTTATTGILFTIDGSGVICSEG